MSQSGQQILALNSGSSSLKFALFESGTNDETLLLEGSAEGVGRENGVFRISAPDGTVLVEQQHVLETQQDALQKVAQSLKEHRSDPVAVGHRIVHGGPQLLNHQRITPAVLNLLEKSVHFAPLHIPPSLRLLKQAEQAFPAIRHFACFDTVFHQTMPAVASHLPIPGRYFDMGVRRYGFHGLSYESLLYRLGNTLPSRAIFCHLGNGSSVTAVRDGISIDTSMGLTPTGGVPMGSRSGDVDPGLLLYLARVEEMSPNELETFFNHECGLVGLSNGESDMQALLDSEARSDQKAALAVDAFCAAVKKSIGAYAALMGGIDVLVFTGGIGFHSTEVRKRLLDGLGFLALSSAQGSSSNILVMKSEEEIQIARHVRGLLQNENR